jgi:hypothetical protein
MHEIDTYVFGQHDPRKTSIGENQIGVDVYRRPQRKITTQKTFTSEPGTIETLLESLGVP